MGFWTKNWHTDFARWNFNTSFCFSASFVLQLEVYAGRTNGSTDGQNAQCGLLGRPYNNGQSVTEINASLRVQSSWIMVNGWLWQRFCATDGGGAVVGLVLWYAMTYDDENNRRPADQWCSWYLMANRSLILHGLLPTVCSTMRVSLCMVC